MATPRPPALVVTGHTGQNTNSPHSVERQELVQPCVFLANSCRPSATPRLAWMVLDYGNRPAPEIGALGRLGVSPSRRAIRRHRSQATRPARAGSPWARASAEAGLRWRFLRGLLSSSSSISSERLSLRGASAQCRTSIQFFQARSTDSPSPRRLAGTARGRLRGDVPPPHGQFALERKV